MIDLGKHNLIGVHIDAVDYEGAVERVLKAAHEGRRCTTTALAVHGVMTGALDATHRHRLNSLDLVVPDGMPVRWGLNLLHKTKLPDRVYGPNLMLKVCEAAAEQQVPIFLFGSDQTTLGLFEGEIASEVSKASDCRRSAIVISKVNGRRKPGHDCRDQGERRNDHFRWNWLPASGSLGL